MEKISSRKIEDPLNSPNGLWQQESSRPVNEGGNEKVTYEQIKVRKTNGEYSIELSDDPKDKISVPEDLAKVVIVGILAEKRFRERFKKQVLSNQQESNSFLEKLFQDFYCHKTVAYALGLTSGQNAKVDPETIDEMRKMIDHRASFGDFTQMKEYVATNIDKDKYPILAKVYSDELIDGDHVHTFLILGKTENGDYVCFEKMALGSFPVRVARLNAVFDSLVSDDTKVEYSFLPLDLK
jgi:hypothetical protein